MYPWLRAACLWPLLCVAVASTLASTLQEEDIDVPPDRQVPVPANEAIPVEDFFRPSLFQLAALNLSGTRVAAVADDNVIGPRIVLKDLVKGTTLYFKGDELHWLTDNQLLYFNHKPRYTGCHIVQVDSRWSIRSNQNGSIMNRAFGKVIGISLNTDDPLYAWVLRDEDGPLKIEALSGLADTRYPVPPDGTCLKYDTDKDGALAFAFVEKDGVESMYRLADEAWRKCPVNLDEVEYVGPGDRADEIIVSGPRQAGRPRAVQRMDAASGKLGEVLYQDPSYDFGHGVLMRARRDGRILGLHFNHARPYTVWFDKRFAALQARFEAGFPDEVVSILGTDGDENRVLVATNSNVDPGAVYLFDVQKQSTQLLAKERPWFDPSRMNPAEVVTYRSRDGIPIEAYLTLPRDAPKGKPLPAVVIPLDGSDVRTWAFNSVAQLLASRGYAVFEPNFRGTPGSMWRFPREDAWNYGKMNDDVTDGVRAMIQLGRIDPGRIAINGYAGGGHLALDGVSSEPDLYRCAVSSAGYFDMALYMKEARANILSDNPIYDLLVRHLGDPNKNPGAFARISPIRRVDRIKVPVFVAHSQNPFEPSSEQAANLISALKGHHSPYVEWDGEYHERSPGDVLAQEYTAILAFLAKNMGGAPTAQAGFSSQGPAAER